MKCKRNIKVNNQDLKIFQSFLVKFPSRDMRSFSYTTRILFPDQKYFCLNENFSTQYEKWKWFCCQRKLRQ